MASQRLDQAERSGSWGQETMVEEDVQRRAEELRSLAMRLRRLADRTRAPDPRRALQDLAERFDRMACILDGCASPEKGC